MNFLKKHFGFAMGCFLALLVLCVDFLGLFHSAWLFGAIFAVFAVLIYFAYGVMRMNRLGFKSMFGACAIIFFGFQSAHAQTIGVQTNAAGLPPISQGRNLQITTLNDSTAVVISKPLPTNSLPCTNDLLDYFNGSIPEFSITGEGSITNLGTNAAGHSLTNLGVESGITNMLVTTNVTIPFPVPFYLPPVVVIGHYASSVTPNYLGDHELVEIAPDIAMIDGFYLEFTIGTLMAAPTLSQQDKD